MSIQRQLTNERMSQIVSHNGTVYLAGQVGDDSTPGLNSRPWTYGSCRAAVDLAGTEQKTLMSATIT